MPIMRARSLAVTLMLALGSATPGCGDDDGSARPIEGTSVRFDPGALDGSAGFFDLPWPSPARLRADGHPDLAGFPLPVASPSLESFVSTYLEAIADAAPGFGTNAGAFFGFDGPLDRASLPADPVATLAPDATAFLIDVDPASPERGARVPAHVSVQVEPTIYEPPDLLTVMPVPGFPLRPARTYAAVVTRGARDAGGEPLGSPGELERLKEGRSGDDPVLGALAGPFALLWETLEAEGIDRSEVAAATVFTTRDPAAEMHRIRDWIHDRVPVQPAEGLVLADSTATYHQFDGRLVVPTFQTGTPPFLTEGGAILFDPSGDPIQQGEESIRFTLTVPRGAPPASGWPLVLYAHGTGGDAESVLPRADDFASRGLAGLGLDQPLHGDRIPSAETLNFLFYNYVNPPAAKDNGRQAVAEEIHALRVARELEIPAGLHPEGLGATFDPNRILFMGHSQGATWGPLFLAVEDEVRCGVLSAPGSSLMLTILQKVEPIDIPFLVASFAGTVQTGELDLFHPLLHLVQTGAEEIDALNYARDLALDAETIPTSVLMTESPEDLFVTPDTTDALLAASGGQPVEPLLLDPPIYDLLASGPVAPPVAGNVPGRRARRRSGSSTTREATGPPAGRTPPTSSSISSRPASIRPRRPPSGLPPSEIRQPGRAVAGTSPTSYRTRPLVRQTGVTFRGSRCASSSSRSPSAGCRSGSSGGTPSCNGSPTRPGSRRSAWPSAPSRAPTRRSSATTARPRGRSSCSASGRHG